MTLKGKSFTLAVRLFAPWRLCRWDDGETRCVQAGPIYWLRKS